MDPIDREVSVSNGVLFLEKLEENARFHHLEFTKRRTKHGPGHSVAGEETVDFDLRQGGGFGEQTALVWSKEENYLAIQYNHFGPRVGVIAKYLTSFLESFGREKPFVELLPEIDETVMARLRASRRQTEFEIVVDRELLNNALTKENKTIAAIANLGDSTNARTLTVKLSRKFGSLMDVKQTAQALANISKKLQVGIDFDSRIEVLDLLRQLEVREIDEERLVRTNGLRWDFPSRIRAIQSELDSWMNQQQF